MAESKEDLLNVKFDDPDQMQDVANNSAVENAIHKYSSFLDNNVNVLTCDEYAHLGAANEVIDKILDMMCKAWSVSKFKLRYALCNTSQGCRGLDLLINNCVYRDKILQFSSARLLEQCLIMENRDYELEKGVEKVVHAVCEYKAQTSSVDKSNISAGEKCFFF